MILHEYYSQRIIEYSLKHGKSEASRKYKEALSNIKRWAKRYDGTFRLKRYVFKPITGRSSRTNISAIKRNARLKKDYPIQA